VANDENGGRRGSWALPFLAGAAAAAAGVVVLESLGARRSRATRRLLRRPRADERLTPVVVVPGIMGSGLHRPDGTQVWLNLRNAVGQYNLGLPFTLPLCDSRDELLPGALLGSDAMMPRLFGFTEYYDLLEMLDLVGFRPARKGESSKAAHHVFSYDWRRDLVESARRLHATLEELADGADGDTRVNLVGHSMGGLVARYYLRYGTAEPAPDQPVTWAGARYIRNLILVGVPNGGSLPALEGLLYGNRVGLSYTTLAAPVIARMPSVYQLVPPAGTDALLDQSLSPVSVDLHDVECWKRFGWGPFGAKTATRQAGFTESDLEAYPAFLEAALARARSLHAALARSPETPCPVRVALLGGDCLPTLARGVLSEKDGKGPRFEPRTRREAEAMMEPGDGRVTRASLLASHLPAGEDHPENCGIPEASYVFVGSADHHGIYREPSFQSILMRMLLKPLRVAATAAGAGDRI
jgi:pimeloyl-ACP methyl ester carboxylesterase